MTAVTQHTNISNPLYYYRDYQNDVSGISTPKFYLEQAKRAALISLPFFSLYRPFSFPITLVMGGVRVLSCGSGLVSGLAKGDTSAVAYSSVQTTIAVAAFAATIFIHPLGMLVTSAQDILIGTHHLLRHLQNRDYKNAVLCCLSIINNALYISMFVHGGFELAIASLAMQILIGLIYTAREFRKGNYPEGLGQFLMCMIRGVQLTNQVKLLAAQREIKKHLPAQAQQEKKAHQLSKAVSRSVGKSSKDYDRGLELMGQKQYGEAIKAFDLAIKTDPSNAQIWFQRYRAYDHLGAKTEARNDLNAAINLDPANGQFLFWKALGEPGGSKEYYYDLFKAERLGSTEATKFLFDTETYYYGKDGQVHIQCGYYRCGDVAQNMWDLVASETP